MTEKLVLIMASSFHRNFASFVTNHEINVNNSMFTPIPELFRPDGDVSVIFLSGNGIRFYEETEDAWYRATAAGYRITDQTWEGTRRMYWPEEAASPLGCARQIQFCNTALPPDKQCGPLAGWDDAVDESAELFNLTRQQMLDDQFNSTDPTASRFLWVNEMLNHAVNDPVTIMQILGPSSLASKASLFQGFMGRIPTNQWQLDVAHWWSTWLASIQAGFVQTAIGPAVPTEELEQLKVAPWNGHMRTLCNNQVCQSFQNFVYPR